MKKRLWRICLAVMLCFALLAVAVSFVFEKERITFVEEEDPARPETCIEGYAGPKKLGHFVADLIDYEVVIVYCDNFKINTERLKRALNIESFDAVGEARISRKSIGNGTVKIVLTQAIQAIDVFPGEEYKFDDIPVEYLNETLETEHIYWIKDIKPIYISRFVVEDSVRSYYKNPEVLDFRPLKPRMRESESRLFEVALIFAGALLVLFGAVELAFVLKPKRVRRVQKKFGHFDHVLEIIRQVEYGAKNDPRHAMHQLYNLMLSITHEFPGDLSGTIDSIAKSIEIKAYSKDEPSLNDVKEKVKCIEDLLENDPKVSFDHYKRGGDT